MNDALRVTLACVLLGLLLLAKVAITEATDWLLDELERRRLDELPINGKPHKEVRS